MTDIETKRTQIAVIKELAITNWKLRVSGHSHRHTNIPANSSENRMLHLASYNICFELHMNLSNFRMFIDLKY